MSEKKVAQKRGQKWGRGDKNHRKLVLIQKYHMGSESINDIFHSVVKSVLNVTIYHSFQNREFVAAPLLPHFQNELGVSWPDEKNI